MSDSEQDWSAPERPSFQSEESPASAKHWRAPDLAHFDAEPSAAADPPVLAAEKKVWENEGGTMESAVVAAELAANEPAADYNPFVDAALDETHAAVTAIDSPIVSPAPMPSLTDWRLQQLTQYIERYPNTPTNYVLRGEVYLALHDLSRASADFERALELSEARLDVLDWGYATAAYIDRARNGLRQLNRLAKV